MVSDARPGVQNFSKSTLPEANRMVRDLRELTQSLQGFTDRLNQSGIGGTLGPEKLPDYTDVAIAQIKASHEENLAAGKEIRRGA